MEQEHWEWMSCHLWRSRMAMAAMMMMMLVFTSSASAADAHIAHSALATDQPHQPLLYVGRSLLQAQKSCPINFENQNYTIITSRCKGPRYLASECCPAFKDFACKFADQLNDLTNMCAQTMFSYINLNGGYPPGIFANECKDSKRGLECPADDTSASTRALHHRGPLMWLFAAAAFLVFCQVL